MVVYNSQVHMSQHEETHICLTIRCESTGSLGNYVSSLNHNTTLGMPKTYNFEEKDSIHVLLFLGPVLLL